MDYLLQQIFWFLLIAFVLGLLVGWWLSGRRGGGNSALEARIAELEAALEECRRGDSGTPIEDIEGIGTGFGGRLRKDGIKTTEKLLELCASDDGVRRVCACVDLDENTVRNWGTMADLMRIPGLGGQWAELLWRSGVASVQDLAGREVGPLVERMAAVNTEEHRVHELPGENRMKRFIDAASQLDPVLPD